MEPPVVHVATSREKAAQQPDEPDEPGHAMEPRGLSGCYGK